MSQDGSFPGRPAGRRARHGKDAPPWQGYDGTPPEEREFPDLPPIRPGEARARDGRAPGDRQPQDWQPQGGRQPQPPGQPPQGGWPQGAHAAGAGYPADGSGYPAAAAGYQGASAGYPGGPAGYPPTGPGQAIGDPFAADRFGTPPLAGGKTGPQQWRQGQPGGFAQPGQRQQPAQALGAQALGAQALGAQPRGAQPPAPSAEQSEEDIPSWAEPDSAEAFSERWRRRGLDSRDDRRADRRRRRRMLFAGGGVLAVVIAVSVYFLVGGGSSATPGFGNLITSFLPGELQQVPDACNTVPNAMLNEYLNGTRKIAAPPLNTGASTACTWTLDNPPTYRVLEVQIQAYSPSALYGNGSATDAAELNYASFEQGFAKPGPKSGQPPAKVTDLSGMPGGTDTSAFMASQVFKRGNAVTDVANVLVRYRNVIITVVVDGLDQATGTKTYGPVSMSDLTSAAQAVAKQVAGQVVGLSPARDRRRMR